MGSIKNNWVLSFLPLVSICVLALSATPLQIVEASPAGCTWQEVAPPPTPAELSSETESQESADIDPVVTLLEAGQAPHRALRFRPTVGQQQRHELEMSVSMASDAGGQAAPQVKVPTIKYTLDSTVSEVAENGDISFTVEFADAAIVDSDEVEIEMLTPIEELTKSMIGMQVKSTVDQRGFAKEVVTEFAEGIESADLQQIEQLSESLQQLTSPFPLEPVGVGGKWKVVVPMNTGGMEFVQTMEYTVVEMTDDTVTATITVSQQAEEQELVLPEAAETNLDIRLKSLECRGIGRVKLNLASMLADESSIKAEVNVVMVIEADEEIVMTQNVTTEAKLKAVPRPAADTEEQ